MKIFCKNTVKGLVPLYDSDMDEKRKLKLGKDYCVDAVEWEERNYQFLKKFMALIKIGHENTREFPDGIPFDPYRKWATMKAGYYDAYHTKKGVMVEAKSISFKNMKEPEFAELYKAVIDVIIKDIGTTKEEIENNLINFL